MIRITILLLASLFLNLSDNTFSDTFASPYPKGKNAFTNDSTRDSLVLIDFKNQNTNLNWNLEAPMSTWAGVTVNENNCVVKLDLFPNTGIPASIGQLEDLEELKLNFDFISLTIPTSLGQLTKLKVLHLIFDSNSSVFNTSAINGLVNLEVLDISLSRGGSGINAISFEQFSQLRFLRIFFSESNVMPSGIFQLSNLETLIYRNNGTEGDIPTALANLSKLKILDLSSNSFPDVFPPVILQLKNLVSYTNTKRNLDFKVPNPLPLEIDQLTNLEELHIENCEIIGSIPTSIGQLQKLSILNLSENNLTGEIPSALTQLQGLKEINFLGNDLSGQLPENWEQLTSLEILNLGRNNLSGPLPKSMGQLSALKELILELNDFNGTLPEAFSQLSNIVTFRISGNDLHGSFPLISSNSIQSLFLSRNQFTAFPTYNTDGNLRVNISNNRLSFDDILTNLEQIPSANFTYTPQAAVFEDTTITLIERSPFVFDLGIDPAIPSNNYAWSKDRQSIGIRTNNKLIFDRISLADAGNYRVTVTNPAAPNLTLRGGDLNIQVIPCTEFNNLTILNENIEPGTSLEFANQQISTCGIYRDTLMNQYGCDSIVQLNLSIVENGINLCRQRDSLSLIQFYFHHNGDDWFNSWDYRNQPMDSLFGVTLDEIGRVVKLELDANNLVNDLYSGINQLTALQKLSLSRNILSGSLPNGLATLNHLNYLDLSFNVLTDLDFDLINQISELEHLDLSHNEYINALNNFRGPLAGKLRYLDLSHNLFIGFMTGSNLNLRQLRYLDLSGNGGIISSPRSTNSEFANLEYLDLSNNPLEFVQIDASFEKLKTLKLISCNLDDNLIQLFGPLSPPSLQFIDITDNLFKEIPFVAPENIDRVRIASNFFTLRHILPFSDFYQDTTDYIPQKRLPSRSKVTFAPCDEHLLVQERDGEGTIYEWYYQSPFNDILLKTDTVPFIDLDEEAFFEQQYLNYRGRYIVRRNNRRYESNVFLDTIDVEITSTCLVEENIVRNACIGDEIIFKQDTFTAFRPTGNVCIDLLEEIPDIQCDTIFRITISFQNCTLNKVPSAFTPELAGLNSTFKIPLIRENPSLVPGSRLKILSRQKQLLFEQKDYNNDWNGVDRSGSPLPSGTYYYIFEYGDGQSLQGAITIIR